MKNLISCDYCFKNHKKCDRSQPTCSNCLEFEKECKVSRKPKRFGSHKNNANFSGMVTALALTQESRPSKEKIDFKQALFSFSNKSRFLDKAEFNPKLRLLALKKHPLSLASQIIGIETFDRKSVLQLLTLLNKLEDFKAKRKPILQCSNTVEDLIDSYQVLLKAEAAYFDFINPINPLFIRQYFNRYDHPKPLMLAIWINGLQLLPQSDLQGEILSQLIQKLIEYLSLKLHKPSLSHLQTLILSYISLRWLKPGTPQVTPLLELAHNMVFQLGLHMPLPSYCKIPQRIQIERMMAYSTTIFLNNGLNYTLNYSNTIANDESFLSLPTNFALSLSFYDKIVWIASKIYIRFSQIIHLALKAREKIIDLKGEKLFRFYMDQSSQLQRQYNSNITQMLQLYDEQKCQYSKASEQSIFFKHFHQFLYHYHCLFRFYDLRLTLCGVSLSSINQRRLNLVYCKALLSYKASKFTGPYSEAVGVVYVYSFSLAKLIELYKIYKTSFPNVQLDKLFNPLRSEVHYEVLEKMTKVMLSTKHPFILLYLGMVLCIKELDIVF